MKVQVEELSPIEKKLSIEVDTARVAEELTRAYSALGKQVKLPGFRQGKVPRRILEQRFRERVEDDVIQRVVQSAWLEAVRDHKVEAVAPPQVTNNSGLKTNAPFTFEARVEVKPQVEAKDYQGLPLTRVDSQVTDAEVDERLEQLRQNMARLDAVEGRDVAQAGDFATVDYEALVDGKEFPGSKAEGVTVELAPGELVESNVAALEGAKVGETRELDYTFPADYRVEDVKGKTAHFKFHVKGLKKKIVPELNDDFAKEAGETQSLAELRAKIRSDLELNKKNRVLGEERAALIKALVERNAFEVPKSMVERTIDQMLEQRLRAMARMGMDPRRLNLDFARLREELREEALQEVRGALLFESIALKENLKTTDEDVEKKIAELAKEANQSIDVVRKYFKGPEERQGLSLRLREEKTIEFLKGQAKYS
ncbi:Cell division trigger factor [Cystobacter fuscus DSM 2262]|uniref:Trigger factor n=1 Tax=Cystobacter fuscus (strain ATCC 25194 / DSM 2262 / NBRC 100088 / M29) TaxID=1242864 RepID=S9QCG1_CYSF2|nr:trigger factor [Cystobacter fuscus]EPX59039.1 Cell division trigger factor [Cystobacter fuscus DSM 2262]